MKRIYLLPILSLLAVLTLFSACSDDDKTEESYNPVIKITDVTPTDSTVSFTYETSDATQAAFMIYENNASVAGAAEILSQGTKLDVSGTTYTGTEKYLKPATNYILVAVAGKGSSVSTVVRKSFRTAPETIRHTFKSAIGGFQERNAETGTASYIIDFSTNAYSADGSTEQFPASHLYVTLTGDANSVDLTKLAIPSGTYTLGDIKAPAVGKFYAGGKKDGEPFNTFLTTQQEKGGAITTNIITDGTLTISEPDENGTYKVTAEFVDEEGGKIQGTYEGTIAVDNDSEEVPPSSELPLPESSLTEDLTLNITEGYLTDFKTTRYGYKGRKEVYLNLYAGGDYSTSIDLFLLIDKTKYADKLLPVGKYPIHKWNEFTTPELSSVAGFHVASTGAPDTWLGCNYIYDFSKHVALTDGEVEIIAYDENTKEVELKFTLKDNAATPHTISGTFKGKLQTI